MSTVGKWIIIAGNNDEHILSAYDAATEQDFLTWSGGTGFATSAQTFHQLAGDPPTFTNVLASPNDYLWNVTASGFHLKKNVNHTISSTLISPGNSLTYSWTTSGTLFSPLTESFPQVVHLSRERPTTITGAIQTRGSFYFDPYEAPTSSGGSIVLTSGTTETLTVEIPGNYTISVEDGNNYSRNTIQSFVVSGTGNPNYLDSWEPIGTWKLFHNSANNDTVLASTSEVMTGAGGLLGLDLEAGSLVMSPGSSITLLDANGISTEVDLVGEDGELNIEARGDAAQISILAGGNTAEVNIAATGTNSLIQLWTAGVGSSIQLECNRSNTAITLAATAAGSSINLIGENINIDPETTFTLDGNQPGNPPVIINIGAGNFTLTNGGGFFNISTGVISRFLGVLDAEASELSFRSPRRSAAQLTTENPGVNSGGRIAWDTTAKLLKMWDGGTWQPVASGNGGTGITALVQDGDPTLGGNLKVNGFDIRNNAGFSSIAITPSNTIDVLANDSISLKAVEGGITFSGTNARFLGTTVVTGTNLAFGETLSARSGGFSNSLTISGVPVTTGTIIPGVSSLNSLTGAVTLAAGSDIVITPVGNTLTFDLSDNPVVTSITATTVTGTTGQFGGTLSSQNGNFSNSLTISGVAVNIAAGGDFFANGSVPMTGTFKSTDGSASLPGITFNSDQNTGVYRPGTDVLGFAINGKKALVVSGTTTAAGHFRLLHVAAGEYNEVSAHASNGDYARLGLKGDTIQINAVGTGGDVIITAPAAGAIELSGAATTGIIIGSAQENISISGDTTAVEGQVSVVVTAPVISGTEYRTGGTLRAHTGNFSSHLSATGLVDALNDAAAATAGVAIGEFYHSSGVVKVRLT